MRSGRDNVARGFSHGRTFEETDPPGMQQGNKDPGRKTVIKSAEEDDIRPDPLETVEMDRRTNSRVGIW